LFIWPQIQELDSPSVCLDELLEEADLSGIDVVDSERPKIAKSRAYVLESAEELLQKGLSQRVALFLLPFPTTFILDSNCSLMH